MKEAFDQLFQQAHKAGMEAGNKRKPAPMVVQQHKNQFDDTSPVEKSWYVEGGVCGFAWVNVKPGTTAFARWLKSVGRGRTDSYHGGVSFFVHEFGQSYERKMSYALAFADVLQDAGIKARAYGRLD